MPLYEYVCQSCEARFEQLVRRFGDAVSCPSCASGAVEKQLSVFAVASASPALAPCAAGPCGAGACDASPCGGGGCGLPS